MRPCTTWKFPYPPAYALATLVFRLFGCVLLPVTRSGEGLVHDIAAAGDKNVLKHAFAEGTRDLQVEGSGVVDRVLADDNEGSRHQRFILRLESGHTVLIAHNIDLAPRVKSIAEGDFVSFKGEYDWTPQGGVIHWTHRDPGRRHQDGWLEHRYARYQ